jgi:NTE family protein
MHETTGGSQPAGVGLALSAGGAAGLAHVGVLQVLEEADIPVAVVAGTSMGAYVGALWCAGFRGPELESFAAEIKDRLQLLKLADPRFPPRRGFLKGHRFRRHLGERLGGATFADLASPFLAVAADINSHRRVVLRQGDVSWAVHASCAIPGVLEPVTLDGRELVDGGVVEPLPVPTLLEFSPVPIHRIIAVNCIPTVEDIERCALRRERSPGPERGKKKAFPPLLARRFLRCLNRWINVFAEGNLINILRRSLLASEIRLVGYAAASADCVIHPVFCDGKWYDFENYEKYIALGREKATEALPEILEMLAQPVSGAAMTGTPEPANHDLKNNAPDPPDQSKLLGL